MLRDWLGADPKAILGGAFEPLSILKTKKA
jgi:hypothetical protein